jgi:hypothetical protein
MRHVVALFEALVRLIHNHPHPLLFIEDLQWCDRHARMAALPAALVRPRPYCWWAACAPKARPTQPWAFLSALTHSQQMLEIDLAPLDAVQTAQHASSLAGKKLDADQAARIFRATDGLPLLIAEAVRAGRLEPEPRGSPSPSLPGLRSLVGHRLSLLSPAAQSVIHFAAQLGGAFSYQTLESGRLKKVPCDALDGW